jgi:hypothetical protein
MGRVEAKLADGGGKQGKLPHGTITLCRSFNGDTWCRENLEIIDAARTWDMLQSWTQIDITALSDCNGI